MEGATVNLTSSPTNTQQKPPASGYLWPSLGHVSQPGPSQEPPISLHHLYSKCVLFLLFFWAPDILKTRPKFQITRQPCISPEYEVNLACCQDEIIVHSEACAAPVTHPARALFMSIHHPTSWTLCENSVVHQEGWTKFVYPETWQEIWVKKPPDKSTF